MASLIGVIKAKILEHLQDDTDLEIATETINFTTTKYPFAQVYFGGMEYQHDTVGVFDRFYDVSVWVWGGTVDEVDELLETIGKLWENLTRFAELRALNVFEMKIFEHDPPAEFGTDSKVAGELRFELGVRYVTT
jgi:hypothetical protein